MKRSSRRAIRIPTPEYLKNAALFYLSRYAASEASLRRVLHNRLRRAAMAHPAFANDAGAQAKLRAAIEDIIAAHRKTGALNDKALAAIKVANLRRSGRSQHFIRQKLGQRGLDAALVGEALAAHDRDAGLEEGEAEMKAAAAYAKRRRLGPFRAHDRKKDGDGKKDFAALARAGFGMTVIRKILGTQSDEMFDLPE